MKYYLCEYPLNRKKKQFFFKLKMYINKSSINIRMPLEISIPLLALFPKQNKNFKFHIQFLVCN